MKLWTLLAILVFASPTQVLAQNRSDDDLARSHFMAGESYFQQGRYEEAAAQFMDAFALSNRGVLLINAATAYERALRFDDAIELLERHQREFPDSEQHQTVANKIQALIRLRDRQAAGHPVEAPEDTPPEDGSSSAATVAPAASSASSEPGALMWAGVGLGGLALASAAVAIATGVVSDSTYQELRTACPRGACSNDDFARVADGAMLADVSTIFTFVGGVSALGAVTLIVLDLVGIGREEEHADLEVGVGLASVSLGGHF